MSRDTSFLCKNCGHELLVDQRDVTHVTQNHGYAKKCPVEGCSCINAQRKRKPKWCKNCKNCEVIKSSAYGFEGRLVHISVYYALHSRYGERLPTEECLLHHCKKPGL